MLVIIVILGFGVILLPIIVYEIKYKKRDNSTHNYANHRNNENPFILPQRQQFTGISDHPRQPLPGYLRNQIYYRSYRRCENPFCNSKNNLEIHHIDMNRDNNKLSNLIALCSKCHTDAHLGKYPPIQLHNWMSMDYNLLLKRQHKPNPSIYSNQ